MNIAGINKLLQTRQGLTARTVVYSHSAQGWDVQPEPNSEKQQDHTGVHLICRSDMFAYTSVMKLVSWREICKDPFVKEYTLPLSGDLHLQTTVAYSIDSYKNNIDAIGNSIRSAGSSDSIDIYSRWFRTQDVLPLKLKYENPSCEDFSFKEKNQQKYFLH